MDPRLVAALRKLDDPSLPIAETCRRVGALAGLLELPRPSYEQIRVLVHAERRRAVGRRAKLEVVTDVYFGGRSPKALFEIVE